MFRSPHARLHSINRAITFALNKLAVMFPRGMGGPRGSSVAKSLLMMIHPDPGALVWPAAMIVWGPGFTAARHSHHCVQLVMVMQGTLRIRSGPQDTWKTCGAALIRPDAAHEVDVRRGRTLLIAFVNAESELGAALSETISSNICRVPARQVARWRSALGTRLNQVSVERWVRRDLLNGRRAVRIHPRVSRMLKYLRRRLGKGEDLSP